MTVAGGSARLRLRHALVVLHRYVGLAITAPLIVVGLTGAVLAWNDHLERVFAARLFIAAPSSQTAPQMDPFTMLDRVQSQLPHALVTGVDFTHARDENVQFGVDARPGETPPPYDTVFADPVNGHVVGARQTGAISQGLVNLVPFIDELHEQLALGVVGSYAFGIVALLWTLDCFVGIVLSLPGSVWRKAALPGRQGFSSWLAIFKIHWPRNAFKFNYEWHRATALAFWFILLAIAWSAVAFNLTEIYRPVMGATLGLSPDTTNAAPHPPIKSEHKVGWRQAHDIGLRAIAQEAQRGGFKILSERLMYYDPDRDAYALRVRSSRDVARIGNTQIWINAASGAPFGFTLPTGQQAGDTFTTWIEAIHEAEVFGWPMRVLITFTGLIIAGLSVTGFAIWKRKRHARNASHRRKKNPSAYLSDGPATQNSGYEL